MAKIDRLGWTVGTTVAAYGIRVGIRSNDEAALDELLQRLPPGSRNGRFAKVERLYSLWMGPDRPGSTLRRFHLLYDGPNRLARTRRLDELYARFENSVQHLVASSARGRIFVHAGVVGWRGRAIVMPGPSFSGKTTIVSALLRAGATYYSDEYAVLDDRGRVHPYTRPLSVRARAGRAAGRSAAEAFGSVPGVKPLPVGIVALLRYEPGAPWRPRRLSPGRATLALLANTVPARDAPERSLRALQQIVEATPVYRGRRGEADETVDRLLTAVGKK